VSADCDDCGGTLIAASPATGPVRLKVHWGYLVVCWDCYNARQRRRKAREATEAAKQGKDANDGHKE